MVSSNLQVHSSFITDMLSQFSWSSDYNKSIATVGSNDWCL